jgi:hypothetical protein
MEIVLIVAEKEYKRLGTTHYVRKDFTRDHWQQAAAGSRHPAAPALARARRQQAAAPCCTRPGEGSLAERVLQSWRTRFCGFGLKFHFPKAPMTLPVSQDSYFSDTNTCKKEFRMELALAQDWVKRGIYEFMEKGLPYLDFCFQNNIPSPYYHSSYVCSPWKSFATQGLERGFWAWEQIGGEACWYAFLDS